MAGLLNVISRVGGLLGVDPQQAPQSQAQPSQGGITVTDANGNVINPAVAGAGVGGPDPSTVTAGLLATNPQQAQQAPAAANPQGMAAAPGIPLPTAPNAALGAIDKLLFGGAFAAAQNDALQRRMAVYQAQQLTAYGNSLPDDQKRAFFADPQGFIKTQEEIQKNTMSPVRLSDTAQIFGGPGGQVIQAGSYGINDSTNKPFAWAPNVTNLGTGVQSGGQFQAGPSIGTGQPTAANGIITGKPTDQFPSGVVGTYSTSQSTPLPGQTVTTSPNVTWAPNGGGAAPSPGYAAPPPAQGVPSTFTFQAPVDGPVTSGFGLRTPPMAGATSNHQGIDIGVPTGTPVAAAAPGVVTFADRKGGYGRTVEITHPDGTVTRYAHLASMNVGLGAHVDGGARIGASGESGTATGPNLHFQVIRHGRSVDPRSVIGTQGTATQQDASDQPTQSGIRGSVTTTGGGNGGSRYSVVDGAQVPGGKPGERWTVDSLGVDKPTPVPGGFTMDTVQHNRESFYKSEQYKNATENVAPVKGMFDMINSVAPGGVVSQGAIDTLNKSFNPGGIVRPASVNLLLDHLGLPEELKSHILSTVGQGFLSPQIVQQIGRASWVYARSHIQQARDLAQKDEALAVAHGYSPTDVGETAPGVPSVPRWAQDQVPPPQQRVVGKVYWGPNGPGRWNGKGWDLQ